MIQYEYCLIHPNWFSPRFGTYWEVYAHYKKYGGRMYRWTGREWKLLMRSDETPSWLAAQYKI